MCFLIWNSFSLFPLCHQMECQLPISLPFSYSDAFNDERRCTLTFFFSFPFFFFFYYYQAIGWVVDERRLVRQKRPHLQPSLYSGAALSASLCVQKVDALYIIQLQHCCFSFFFRCFSFVHIMTSSTKKKKKSKVPFSF